MVGGVDFTESSGGAPLFGYPSSPAASKNNHMAHAYLDSASLGELLLAVKNRLDAQTLTNYIPDECVFILS